MAENKNLSMQNGATSETISKAEKQSQHECRKDYMLFLCKCNDFKHARSFW
jgi:hypothetical protein